MVDLDIGTEGLRWMGDARFVLGFLKGVVSNSNFKARIRINVVEDDKIHMARIARERSHVAPATMGEGQDPLNPGRQGRDLTGSAKTNTRLEGNSKSYDKASNGEGSASKSNGNGSSSEASNSETQEEGNQRDAETAKGPEDDGPLPDAEPLRPDDSWLTIDSGSKNPKIEKNQNQKQDGKQAPPDSILYFYAGMMPWVSRDLNQWPVATVGQGVVDIAIQRVVSGPYGE
jgi:sphingosine kinase